VNAIYECLRNELIKKLEKNGWNVLGLLSFKNGSKSVKNIRFRVIGRGSDFIHEFVNL